MSGPTYDVKRIRSVVEHSRSWKQVQAKLVKAGIPYPSQIDTADVDAEFRRRYGNLKCWFCECASVKAIHVRTRSGFTRVCRRHLREGRLR